MRVARDELEAAQTLEIGMRHDGLDQPLAQPASPVRLEHVNITEIGKRRAIGHDSREPDLAGHRTTRSRASWQPPWRPSLSEYLRPRRIGSGTHASRRGRAFARSVVIEYCPFVIFRHVPLHSSRSEAALSPRRSAQLAGLLDADVQVRRDHHLRDLHPGLHVEASPPMVNQYYTHLSPIAVIDRAWRVQHADAVLQRQSASRPAPALPYSGAARSRYRCRRACFRRARATRQLPHTDRAPHRPDARTPAEWLHGERRLTSSFTESHGR